MKIPTVSDGKTLYFSLAGENGEPNTGVPASDFPQLLVSARNPEPLMTDFKCRQNI